MTVERTSTRRKRQETERTLNKNAIGSVSLTMMLPLFRFALSFLVLVTIASSPLPAGLASQDPTDYDLAGAKQAFHRADQIFSSKNQELKTLQSTLSKRTAEVAKLQALIDKLSKTNPQHPSMAKSRTRIAQIDAELALIIKKIPLLSKALVPLKERRDAASARLQAVKANTSKAENYLSRLAADLAQVAKENAYPYALSDGQIEGDRRGREIGRSRGEEIGVRYAQREGIERGRRSGFTEGASAGSSEAVKAAYDSGEKDAWEERGYSDGYAQKSENPSRDSGAYLDAYQYGRQRALNQSFAKYHPGVDRADALYRSQALDSLLNPNLQYNESATPWISR
ncbi:MAG: hypothetical protein AAGB46_02555, partial [Verrucomicrobiota bacterium]